MSSFFDEASLVFIPSGYKTSKAYSVKPTDGSGDLSFSRSNDTASRIGPDGLIEKVRSNFALRSQSFATSAVWSTAQGTITDNDGIAPDGTNTASKIVATNNDPYAYQSISLSGPVVASCYVKGIGNSIGQNATIIAANASLQSFVITGDWQRISVTGTASGSQLYGIEAPNSSVSVGDTVLVWGFQVEYGDVATDYIATTTAAVSVGPVANVPRLDYLNSSCPRLLLEPQRTNALTNSENFSSGYFTTDVTVTSNTSVSPDGYTSADTITEGTANDLHRVGQNFSAVSGSVYTASIFCKAGSGTRNLGILFGCGFGEQEVVFNVNNGTIVSSSGATGTITNYGNGWYRCTATATSDSTTSTCAQFQLRSGTNQGYVGNGTSSLIYWGAQVEAGSYATSYIPTLGAAVTRGADAAYKASISTLIGQTEGVAFIDFVWNGLTGVGSYPRVIELWGDSNNYIQLFTVSGSANIYWDLYVGGAVQASGNAAMALGRNKIAVAYKTNDFAIYKNGTLIVSDTSCTVPATSSLGVAGSYAGSGAQLAASVNQALLFKTRLTNAQLAELTTI